ncbi:MAG: phosphopantetheine-binding protein [Bacteroidales bacterium]|jgi:acyl carrier protein|nr:phosphopantetheine-binding protein [Bacteroidales bacterium]
MELNSFIKDFAAQFDDTDISVFNSDTSYRDLEEWSSLNALAVINMIEKKYSIRLMPQEMRATSTIQELFDLVRAKE